MLTGRRPWLTVLLVAAVLAAVGGCGGTKVSLVVQTETPTALVTASPAATPTEVQEDVLVATPSASPEPTATPHPNEELLAHLPENYEADLDEELRGLVDLAEAWDSDAQVSLAVALPDGLIYGIDADALFISASSVKPLWVSAALATLGVEAVANRAQPTVVDSNNLAGGEIIDLAGGVDAVNTWVWDIAGLADTRLEAWRFGDSLRFSENFQPGAPLGNRTTMANLAGFYANLYQGELLGPDETAALVGWLQSTSRSLSHSKDVDGALLDRLPASAVATALHKGGWLPPNCCSVEYRSLIDAGLVFLPEGGWFAIAVVSQSGQHYDLAGQWVALAACRVYALLANDFDLVCQQSDDGIPDPEIWSRAPEAEPSPEVEPSVDAEPSPDAELPVEVDPPPEVEPTAEAEPSVDVEPPPEVEPSPEAEPSPDTESLPEAES